MNPILKQAINLSRIIKFKKKKKLKKESRFSQKLNINKGSQGNKNDILSFKNIKIKSPAQGKKKSIKQFNNMQKLEKNNS